MHREKNNFKNIANIAALYISSLYECALALTSLTHIIITLSYTTRIFWTNLLNLAFVITYNYFCIFHNVLYQFWIWQNFLVSLIVLTEKDQETTSEESEDCHEHLSLSEGDLKATSNESEKEPIVLRGTMSWQSEKGHRISFDTPHPNLNILLILATHWH